MGWTIQVRSLGRMEWKIRYLWMGTNLVDHPSIDRLCTVFPRGRVSYRNLLLCIMTIISLSLSLSALSNMYPIKRGNMLRRDISWNKLTTDVSYLIDAPRSSHVKLEISSSSQNNLRTLGKRNRVIEGDLWDYVDIRVSRLNYFLPIRTIHYETEIRY